MRDNLQCKWCHCDSIKTQQRYKKEKKSNNNRKANTNHQKYEVEIYGIAHNIFYKCTKCGNSDKKFVLNMFLTHFCFIRELVADDDSSMRKVCRHKNKALFDLGMIEVMPRYDNGSLKPDNGELPITHPAIHFFSDRNHCVRSIAKELFVLCRKPLKECIGNTHNAERLKRNLSYTIRHNCTKTIEELHLGVKSVLEHHFDNHEHCGTWCQCKGKTKEEKKELKLKYRNKQLHEKFYMQCKIIFDKALKKVADVHHPYNSNVCEGFNKLITKFVPKNRQFNRTREYETRVNIAVCIDSIGFSETYWQIFEDMGMQITYNTMKMFYIMDKRRIYKRQYYQKIEVKRKRIQKLQDKLREGERLLK